jgi:hypothetical protein
MMFHLRFIRLLIGALLLGIIGVRGASPVCSTFPSAQSNDCSKLIDMYLADDTIATIDSTGHAVISSASCAIAAIPNGYVERITNDYLARHGLSIYDGCGNSASMAGFQTDASLPTVCVLAADSYVFLLSYI